MKTLATLLLILLTTCIQAQEFGININYQLISASEWNKATQTYNFSRPFLPNKQPLLQHGVNLSFYYLGSPDQTWALGPALSLSLHRSSANNSNFNIGINSILLDLGWRIQYRPEEYGLFLAFTPSLTGVTLNRTLNGEVVIIGPGEEDQTLRTFGLGAGIQAQIGYDFDVGGDWSLSPVVAGSYHPYLWAERSDVIFNEAATGGLKPSTSIWGVQGGMILRRNKY